jgi:hypothetical protein
VLTKIGKVPDNPIPNAICGSSNILRGLASESGLDSVIFVDKRVPRSTERSNGKTLKHNLVKQETLCGDPSRICLRTQQNPLYRPVLRKND